MVARAKPLQPAGKQMNRVLYNNVERAYCEDDDDDDDDDDDNDNNNNNSNNNITGDRCFNDKSESNRLCC